MSGTKCAVCCLQGLSFHLGAVLLSLGFITYVEHGKINISYLSRGETKHWQHLGCSVPLLSRSFLIQRLVVQVCCIYKVQLLCETKNKVTVTSDTDPRE